MTWLINSAKDMLLMIKMTLLLRTFHMRCHIQKMVTIGDNKESVALGDQKMYTTPMQLSQIFSRGDNEDDKVEVVFNFIC